MKATGIVRRLDDLGRLVIPKEIRKQYRLKEGDSIEFYIEDDKIIIQKHDVMSRHIEEIKIMCETLESMYENTVLFIQEDWIATQSKKLKDTFVTKTKIRRVQEFSNELIYDEDEKEYNGLIYPVVSYGDWYGAFVILFEKRKVEKDELSAVEAFVKLLTRQQVQ